MKNLRAIIIDPDYNILSIDTNREKYEHAWQMFSEASVIKKYSIQHSNFMNLIQETQNLYDKRGNYFHNFNHGLAVLQCSYYFMTQTSAGKYFGSLGKLAMLFAALMHDVDHTGFTNIYEMNLISELAIIYNDQSILENHHCATAFRLVSKPKNRIFDHIDKYYYARVRSIVIKGILSTDVTKHFALLNDFKVLL